jgi:RHS repeat-associated protein
MKNEIELPAETRELPYLTHSYHSALGAGSNDKLYYFHANHLGSGVLITDGSGDTYQMLAYAPFGEGLINVRYGNDYDEPYKFSGKIKDEESGLMYFEARYYSSDLGIFPTTDPHWYNYPNLSPYAYCANNPIRYIDPTGMDEWEIDAQGNVVNQIKTDKHDAFFMVDKDGNRIDGQSISFDYGTVKHKNNTYPNGNYDIFKVKGDENGTALFELMANNTNVEIGLTRTGLAGKGTNYITTSHNEGSESGFKYLFNGQLKYLYYIRERTHSHPNGSIPVPSGMPGTKQEGTADIYNAQQLVQASKDYGYKSPIFNIYMQGFGYQKYTPNSQVSDFEHIYNALNKRPAMK